MMCGMAPLTILSSFNPPPAPRGKRIEVPATEDIQICVKIASISATREGGAFASRIGVTVAKIGESGLEDRRDRRW
jgi:hypothetical protein